MLGIRVPESLLKEVEFVDRAIGLIIELIFEFCRPKDVSDGNTDQNHGNRPPNERCKCGGGSVRRCCFGELGSGLDHGSTLTDSASMDQFRDYADRGEKFVAMVREVVGR